MRPIQETLLFADARRIILDAAVPIARIETTPLVDAHGRVLARDLVATADVPPFDRASMDGYAVIAEDTFGSSAQSAKPLVLVGQVLTGQVPTRRVARGECIEIATGAPMPDGADAVVMVEETERAGDTVGIRTPVYPRQNVGRRGADMTRGQTVLASGQFLNASRIGAAAAQGATALDVYARPRVAILSTGNEIVEPGAALAPGQIYDINRFTLGAIVRAHGGAATILPTALDDLAALDATIDAAAAHDLIIFSGGSSVGERDLTLDAIRRRGTVLVHGVAVKPGKPMVFGLLAGGTPIFGMPGYPTSCLSNAYMMLVPFLRIAARLPPWEPRTIDLPLSRRVVSTTGRHQFYPVRIAAGSAEPAFKASGDITSMAHADGYIEIPAQTDIVDAGAIVTVRMFDA